MTKQRLGRSGLRQSGFLQTIRTLFTVCAWLFGGGVVAQVFFAGLGVLVDPSYFTWHETFAHILEPLLLVLLITGIIGRVGWRIFGLTALSFVLFGLQYVFMYGFQGPLRALHVVNALALFWFAIHLGRWSWHLPCTVPPTPTSNVATRTTKKEDFSLGRQFFGILAVVVGAVMLFGIVFDNGPGLFSSDGFGISSRQSEPLRSSAVVRDKATPIRGEAVFAQHCSSCHGQNGEGGVGPTLAGNADLEDTRNVVRQILRGDGGMPAFGERLPNEDVSAVTTFIRTSWSNAFGSVAAAEVEAQR